MHLITVAPIKALCSERYEDWRNKFGSLGLTCLELTGDSDIDYMFDLEEVHIILTTPVGITVNPVMRGHLIGSSSQVLLYKH